MRQLSDCFADGGWYRHHKSNESDNEKCADRNVTSAEPPFIIHQLSVLNKTYVGGENETAFVKVKEFVTEHAKVV